LLLSLHNYVSYTKRNVSNNVPKVEQFAAPFAIPPTEPLAPLGETTRGTGTNARRLVY